MPYNLRHVFVKGSFLYHLVLITASFLFVAFGQPAWSALLGLVAACVGYALFWKVLLSYPRAKTRFWMSTAWFFAVQLVQWSWMVSHPFLYILLPYVLFSFLWGLQFGVVGLLITPANVTSLKKVLAIAAFWVLCEWSRLFVFSGYSWNLAGLAYAGSIYSLQFASIGGLLALSFWVFLVNLVVLRAFTFKKSFVLAACTALLPFAYGAVKLNQPREGGTFTTLLVQPSFPCEASLTGTPQQMINCVQDQWIAILEVVKGHQGENIDLIVLPEYVVPFGTYTFVYEFERVQQIFKEMYGEQILPLLPKLEDHLAYPSGRKWMVNNAYWMQSLANIFHASIIGGLEDVEDNQGERQHFSSAQYFVPHLAAIPERYDKRVLVPLGEYIPFAFLRDLAASYGVHGTFVPGNEAHIFRHDKLNFGASICYEETFGHLMRENRQKGAELLVNMSNDAWFPHSQLARQHFEHARLRTVENGIPLVRACNTGLTGAVDSLGQTVAVLPEEDPGALLVKVPTYQYFTLYSWFGDLPIVGLSFLFLFLIL